MFVAWMLLLLFAPSSARFDKALQENARTQVGVRATNKDVTLLQGKMFENAGATLTRGLIGGLSGGTLSERWSRKTRITSRPREITITDPLKESWCAWKMLLRIRAE
jgi:hypothetical protein